MAGSAGTIAPTGVVKGYSVVERDVENRLFLAVVFVGQLAVLILHGLALGQECDLHHIFAGCFFGNGSSALVFIFFHNCSSDVFSSSRLLSGELPALLIPI